MRFSRHVQPGHPWVDPELAGGLHISSGLETPQDPPGGAGTSGIPCLICCHRDPTPDKRNKMDGWRNVEQAMFFTGHLLFC